MLPVANAKGSHLTAKEVVELDALIKQMQKLFTKTKTLGVGDINSVEVVLTIRLSRTTQNNEHKGEQNVPDTRPKEFHDNLFYPPEKDDNIVFDPASTTVPKIFFPGAKILYIDEFLESAVEESQKTYASVKNMPPAMFMEYMKAWIYYNVERRVSFVGPGTVEQIQAFINRILSLATFFGVSSNATEEAYKTMFTICWWKGRKQSVLFESLSLQAPASSQTTWSMQNQRGRQAKITSEKNTTIRFIDTATETTLNHNITHSRRRIFS
ncbi:hypothetical protein NHQ30_002972 [Ciborinia camelliae]|nr:hypothetical protein NHQ30_002972 [Ciborinia camelliae]